LYFQKLKTFFTDFNKLFIVNADNVGSNQLQQVRIALRGKSEILMGKNTMIRKALSEFIAETSRTELEQLLPLVRGNIGFVFTNGDLSEIRDIFTAVAIGAPAKAGGIAQCDVSVPAGSTGMDPSKTSFFQALNISTKIVKGTIEIVNDIHLIKKGEKVGASEATLLKMLNVMPFKYFLDVVMIYDNGSLYTNEVLDIKDEHIVAKFMQGVATIAAVSLQLQFPTVASVPHSLFNGFKNALAIAVETDYSFRQAEKVKAYLANPEAFAVAAAPAAASSAPAAAPAAAEESEEEEDAGFSLFD
jgi:large subunit ribosomal protein LP0